jgi:flagellar biosynthesis protein FlhA
MAMSQASAVMDVRQVIKTGLGAPLLLLIMLAMMVVPLPPFLLDVLFTFNISLSLVVLLSGIYAKKPLEFAAFPTVLLITTLLRLALNVASTRVVLLDGHTGTAAAGRVIQAFGEFVIGGNYTVGLVVFSILVIINFVVVTKGAGRISEVSARFTLDAMPGKQMAIDADLNAGLINQTEARNRREEVAREADFYGAMDGASKFVRGDAIAGILILFINIFGGLAVGLLQHGMNITDALHNYTLLTVGDGLVAQIPSLVLSTAAALLVTRVSRAEDMGQQIMKQMFDNPRPLIVTASILGVIGLIPGMPNFIFMSLATCAGGAAYFLFKKRKVQGEIVPVIEKSNAPQEIKELSWDDVTPVDTVGLEVGYRLIPLVDKNQGGQLMSRIKGVRKKLTNELGFLIPSVHIRDNLDLPPNGYSISLMGVTVGESEIYPDRDLAINSGQVFGKLQGIPGRDPAFGLDAIWIEPALRDQAQTMGYTVVDASTVVATHLSQILQDHAHEILGREEVQQLLDSLGKVSPKLVEDLVPNTLPVGVVMQVLRNLLEERVPIRDMRTIAETLAAHGRQSQDSATLTTAVRTSLSRLIYQQINGISNDLTVITLDSTLEQILLNTLQTSSESEPVFEPRLAERVHRSLADAVQKQEVSGQPCVLLVSAALRPVLAKFVRRTIPNLYVLSYNELPDNKRIKVVASIGGR